MTVCSFIPFFNVDDSWVPPNTQIQIQMGKDLALDAKKGDSSNRLAMIHANLSQLRVTVNDDSVFDSPLKFNWQCSEGEADVNNAKTYYYSHFRLVRTRLTRFTGTKISGPESNRIDSHT